MNTTFSLASIDFNIFYFEKYNYSKMLFNYVTLSQARPYYVKSSLYGGTVQWAVGPFILKLETLFTKFKIPAIYRNSLIDHNKTSFGVEYGWDFSNGFGSIVILEYQRVFLQDRLERMAADVFQNDLLLGYRLSLNDLNSTEFTFNFLLDLDQKEEFYFKLGVRRRLSDQWTGEVDYKQFNAADSNYGFAAYDNDKRINLTLIRYY